MHKHTKRNSNTQAYTIQLKIKSSLESSVRWQRSFKCYQPYSSHSLSKFKDNSLTLTPFRTTINPRERLTSAISIFKGKKKYE